jgi:Outer membrane protein beta-barrel domain
LKMTKAGVLALCLCAAPRFVSAQTMQWTDKGYVSVNGGGQVGSHTIETSSTSTFFDETATVSTSQKVKGGGLFDIGGAYRVWGNNLLAGVSYTHTGSTSDVALNATVPHPVFTDQPRTVASTQSGAKHSEDVVHIAAIWMMPIANKLDVGIFGGPSIFAVKQDVVTNVTVTETADPAHPTLNAPFSRVSKTTVGINVGADVQYLIGKKWGVGAIARFSAASIDIPAPSGPGTNSTGTADSLSVGGFQIGVGGRYRF